MRIIVWEQIITTASKSNRYYRIVKRWIESLSCNNTRSVYYYQEKSVYKAVCSWFAMGQEGNEFACSLKQSFQFGEACSTIV